jgi:hypothetical protein
MPLEDVIATLDEQELVLVNAMSVSEDKDNEVIDNLLDNLESQINNPPTEDDGDIDDDF